MLRIFGLFAAASLAAAEPPLEPVRVSADRAGFVLADSGRTFRPWGFNYDHDARDNGRLLEDYWIAEWPTVEADFREMKELGANVVRIHLQFGRFMEAPDRPNDESLRQLRRLLDLAEQTRLHLDLTGLGCYHRKDVPDWYDRMSEAERWAAQARFWGAVARACRDSPAVFCYDLMNEPIVSGGPRDGWLAGELGGKHFVQRITLTPGKRAPHEIAKAWIDKLTAVIRAEDPGRLITVGVIPWAMVWPNAKPIFHSPEAGRNLDFVSVHFYPKKGEVGKALRALAVYDVGKPLLIEEMFPMECGIDEMDEFIRGSAAIAEGWISFYWGKTLQEYESEAQPTLANAIMVRWLKYFRDQSEKMRRP